MVLFAHPNEQCPQCTQCPSSSSRSWASRSRRVAQRTGVWDRRFRERVRHETPAATIMQCRRYPTAVLRYSALAGQRRVRSRHSIAVLPAWPKMTIASAIWPRQLVLTIAGSPHSFGVRLTCPSFGRAAATPRHRSLPATALLASSIANRRPRSMAVSAQISSRREPCHGCAWPFDSRPSDSEAFHSVPGAPASFQSTSCGSTPCRPPAWRDEQRI